MSTNAIFYTQIISLITYVGTAFFLYRLYVQLKDATIEQKGSTIELLKEKVSLLEKQLEAAKNTTPDVLLDRYYKRIERLESEISKLDQDDQTSRKIITEKQAEIDSLNALILQARELIEEFAEKASRVDECPHCEAPLSSMNDVDHEDERAIVTYKRYECGYSTADGITEYPCPADPQFPKLEDYELKTEYLEPLNSWRCTPVPKTHMASLVHLGLVYGDSEEKAREKVIADYNRLASIRANPRSLYIAQDIKH